MAKGGFEALYIAKKKEDELHLVLTEAHLPDMKKYELLEKLKEVSDLPFVIMSDDDDRDGKLNFLINGAAFYIVKPLLMDTLDNLWQYAFYNNKSVVIDTSNAHVELQGMSMNYTRERSEGMDNLPSGNSSTAFTKRRVVSTPELHHRFLKTVKPIGIDGARPKTVVQVDVPGLTKRHISTPLQIGPESSNNMDLAAGFEHVKESLSRANIFQDQNKNSSIVHDFGHQSVTAGCPIIHESIQHNEQQHEEHNSPGEFDAHVLLSPLASQEQEHDNLDRESDDFYKFAEEDTGKVFDDVEEDNVQCFDDEDSI